MIAARLSLFLLLASCVPPGTSDKPDETETGTDPTTPTIPTDTLTTQTTTTTTNTNTRPPWERDDLDCTALLPLPLQATRYTWVPGSEDFTFSADGDVMQVTGGGLKRTPYGGPSELLVPLSYDVRGTRHLPDGRLALAVMDTGSIAVIDPSTGSQVTVASGLQNPNGIAIGADGWIYVATTGRILRIDPDTGDNEIVADMPNNSFDGLTFSHDYTRLYFNEEFGQINYVEFDAQGNPGPPRLGASIPTSIVVPFSILDGMAADACGNLYAVEMNGRVWRIMPDGTVEDIVEIGGAAIIPALNFGIAPLGGWQETSLYVITFTGSIYEIPVGVPGKWEPHLPRAN